MFRSPKRKISAFAAALCMLVLSACGQNISAAITPLPLLQSRDVAAALNAQWTPQSIGETFSIDFPTTLTLGQIGNKHAESALYELTASGISMYALMRPYTQEDEIATKGCDALQPDSNFFVGIDLRKKFLCHADGTSLALIGFNDASEVVDINAVLFFIHEDQVMQIDHVLSIAQISPGAGKMIDDYFRAHPNMTQRWFDEASSIQLDKKLTALLQKELSDPSPSMKAAMAFLERMQASGTWREE